MDSLPGTLELNKSLRPSPMAQWLNLQLTSARIKYGCRLLPSQLLACGPGQVVENGPKPWGHAPSWETWKKL